MSTHHIASREELVSFVNSCLHKVGRSSMRSITHGITLDQYMRSMDDPTYYGGNLIIEVYDTWRTDKGVIMSEITVSLGRKLLEKWRMPITEWCNTDYQQDFMACISNI